MAISNLTVIIQDKTFDGSTCPSIEVATFPYVFPEQIPVNIDIGFTFMQGSDLWEYEVTATGYLTQYANNNKYPCVRVATIGEHGGTTSSIGFYVSCDSATFVGSLTETRKKNGAQTTSYTQASLNWTCVRSSDEQYTRTPVVTISTCTLPVIFNSAIDQYSTYFAENPNVYFYNAVTEPLVTLPTVSLGYNYRNSLNCSAEVVPETKEYFYYGRANEITVNQYGEIISTGAPQLIRGFRVKSTGRVSLYATEGVDDGHLKLMINLADVDIAYYSYDLDTWQNQQGSPTTLPFNFVWRGWADEVGTFYCSGTRNNPMYESNCPIFLTKQESDDYNDTGEGIEGAINYNEISNNTPIFNPTGLDDDTTVFGEVYARAMFTQQYICSTGALQEIANALFDTTQGGVTGIFEDIKKGLEMYGDNVIDAVQGCTFYPFDLNQVFTQVQSQNYIYFGGYKFDLQNHNVNKIIYPNGYVDFGTFTIEKTFNSYRDYSPYQRLYVYLPYLSWYELDLNKYLGKSVNVRYYIDTRSGGLCMAVLSVNSVMTDYMVGQIGVAYPMTLTDYSRFASAQLQTLLGGVKGVQTQGGASQVLGDFGGGVAQGLVEGGMASALTVAGGVGTLGLAMQGTKTLYGLTQNNINNFNKTIGSGATSMLNEYLPQEVCFMFEIQEADETPNERMLQGYPSNSSGTIGSFSGYLQVDTVNLVCAGATANEQAEIVNLLKSGVYI